jgi:SPP1 family predicted phage head-tail adaptor
MPKRVTYRRKHRKPCIGDLRDEIKLQNRNITPPPFDDPDFDETFTALSTVWAGIETVAGKTYFNGVNEVPITHTVTIRFDSTVTAETWIEFNGRRIDILSVEDWEERHEWMILTCGERGSTDYDANKA